MDSSISKWFAERPEWLQVAAKHLLESSELNETVISALSVLCQQEANDEFPDIDFSIPSNALDSNDLEEIRLCSISEITGINILAPKKPLEFGTSNIAVVYGNNGSGKSGYVRLLKHICGARDCIRGKLHKNVFTTEDTDQKAKISFLKDNSLTEYDWLGQGVCNDLCSVDIFDASFGRVFMEGEDEVSYEPPVLSFFSRLISVCEKVAVKLDVEVEKQKSNMPNIPTGLLDSTGANWLGKLSQMTTTDEVEKYCSFTPENETELQVIQKRITEKSPADKAKQLKKKKNYTDSIIQDVQNYLSQLSDENCKNIISAKRKFILKKSVADAAAKEAFSSSLLEGIGSDVWKELWNSARKYSTKTAYKDQEFPVIANDSVCVLCHQPLSDEAKQRFSSFELYIKGETQKQSDLAEKEVNAAIENLPDIQSVEALKTKIDAAGIDKQEIITELTVTFKKLKDRKEKISSLKSADEVKTITQVPTCIEEIRKISEGYEELIKKFTEDAEKDNRDELLQMLKNLQAKKWLTEQKAAIKEEINRLQALQKIQKAKKKTTTTALSKKKGELAETLITDAFVQRFNSELKALGASRIKVKLIKSNVSKGKVLHTLQLDGAAQNTLHDVLSEGENRIVSIAAFLADVTGRNYPAPIVFDDPISSLDQDYEEAVVQRFCSLSLDRQVIIFTHRLSLLGLVQDYAKKMNIDPQIICIREEPWGTGEPGDTPLFAKKPNKALNSLINDRLSKAKKLYNEHGKEVYEPYVKSLCSDFRILIERMIECDLIADVVQRYRRAINTMGKIENLAKISEADCIFFDELMTKYSRYEHSQPQEAPVPLPGPDELESDFKRLEKWLAEFKNRSKAKVV